MTQVPSCWNCGYALSGLQVDDLCPECGKPVWSRPPLHQASEYASKSQTWGIVAIVLMFACIGPLAGFVAIPALVYASKARAEVRQGLIEASQVSPATTGLVLGWITIGLSVLALGAYGIFVIIAIIA